MPSSRPAPPMAPRGPLPARVYWIRRLVVLGRGRAAGRRPRPAPGRLERRVVRRGRPRRPPPARRRARAPTPTETPRPRRRPPTDEAEAQEEAADPDRAAARRARPAPARTATSSPRPTITEAPGGSDVPITLNLRTRVTAGLHLDGVAGHPDRVSITSGNDSIWSSRECPAAIVPQDVVVRQAVDAPVVHHLERQALRRGVLRAAPSGRCPGTTTWRRRPSAASRPTCSSSWSRPAERGDHQDGDAEADQTGQEQAGRHRPARRGRRGQLRGLKPQPRRHDAR